jgi:hypothetical protein
MRLWSSGRPASRSAAEDGPHWSGVHAAPWHLCAGRGEPGRQQPGVRLGDGDAALTGGDFQSVDHSPGIWIVSSLSVG